MNRYICTYGINSRNPFDVRRLVMLIRALSKDEALNIAMSKVKDSDKYGWDIHQVIETGSNIDAVIVVWA
ncbi:hypothetical protein A9G35_02195 [Gilliamella sp. Choc5-1]|jgi:DNA topoisomerase VI subunit A|nr:hypothetical protein A9G35_02195 [Gilliamella apicola]